MEENQTVASESPENDPIPDLTARGTPRKVKPYIRRLRHNAALSRWESVKRERALWLRPFKELPLDRAMAYLEDLRNMCEEAGHILNERIGNEKRKIKCAGPHCGKLLDGLRPNGMPLWIAKKDFRDRKNPEIVHSVYFCSELCHNTWVRKGMGAMGGDGR